MLFYFLYFLTDWFVASTASIAGESWVTMVQLSTRACHWGVGFAITPNLFTSGWRVSSSYTCVGKRFSLHRSWWFYSVDTLLILLVPSESSSQILVLVPVTVRHTARPGGLPGLPLAINMNNNPGHLLSSKGNCRSNFLADFGRVDERRWGNDVCVSD